MPNTIKTGENYSLTKDLNEKARLLAVSGDPARLRLLCFLFQNEQACVSDIAKELKMNIALTSHHLQVLKESGLLSSKREGNNICYSLSKKQFLKDLKNLICHRKE